MPTCCLPSSSASGPFARLKRQCVVCPLLARVPVCRLFGSSSRALFIRLEFPCVFARLVCQYIVCLSLAQMSMRRLPARAPVCHLPGSSSMCHLCRLARAFRAVCHPKPNLMIVWLECPCASFAIASQFNSRGDSSAYTVCQPVYYALFIFFLYSCLNFIFV